MNTSFTGKKGTLKNSEALLWKIMTFLPSGTIFAFEQKVLFSKTPSPRDPGGSGLLGNKN